MLNTQTIGNRITEARKKMNISQAQLAEKLFISSQAVGKWERGESMPDIITLNRLAEILGVDLNYFSATITPSHSSSSGLIEKQPVEIREPEDTGIFMPKKKPVWDMSRTNWDGADFSGLKNLHEKFSSSNMKNCKFNGSDLSELLLKANNVDNCDFSGSDISNSRIQASNLGRNIYKDCSLKETRFSSSNIDNCDFSGANLTGSEFLRSNVYGCNFNGTDFTGVVFKWGGFSGVALKAGESEKNLIVNAVWNRTSFIFSQIADLVIEGTLTDCYFENCAFTRLKFRNATLINTFFKNNNKLKRIQFENCKADRITYEFLKQGKAELSGIIVE